MNVVDIVCGLAWGDEAKGKITSQMSKSGFYDFVCRWSGGNNTGHTKIKSNNLINKKQQKCLLFLI